MQWVWTRRWWSCTTCALTRRDPSSPSDRAESRCHLPQPVSVSWVRRWLRASGAHCTSPPTVVCSPSPPSLQATWRSRRCRCRRSPFAFSMLLMVSFYHSIRMVFLYLSTISKHHWNLFTAHISCSLVSFSTHFNLFSYQISPTKLHFWISEIIFEYSGKKQKML